MLAGISSLASLVAVAFTAVVVGGARGALAYANPGVCSGVCNAHDPAVIKRADGTYFRFNTGGEIGIYKATALTGPWTYQGAVVPAGSSINLAGNTDLWAPDVWLVGSTYILYYAVSTFGSQSSAIGYATSTTLEAGSWTDHGSVGVASAAGKAYNAIDPNLVQDASSGAYYLNFGSFWSDIYQVPLSSSATGIAGTAPYQIAFNASGTHAEEGSFVFYRSPYYYLLFSSGICCGYDTSKPAAGAEYKIMMCRSTAVAGPYVDQNGVACTQSGGSVLLASHGTVYGPGGQGVFVDPSYGHVLYYHYADTTIGIADAQYQFGWNVLGFTGGWPSV